MVSDNEFTGYNPEIERVDEIRETATAFDITYGDYDAPEEVDPRGKIRHDKQFDMGSCAGFSLTNGAEYVGTMLQGWSEYKAEFQFSQLFAYLETQRVDGLLGLDRGSTIAGGLRIGREVGFLPLSDLPYRTPYPSNARTLVTPAMREKAGALKIGSHSWLKSYDDIFNYLASGVGAVHTGTVWNNSFYASNGVLERISLSNGGGHATCWAGYSKRKDSRGRKYIWRLNSHNDSWVEMAPSVIDALCSHRYTSIVGISDLSVPKPRKFDFTRNSILG
jgi:hypothetical protein